MPGKCSHHRDSRLVGLRCGIGHGATRNQDKQTSADHETDQHGEAQQGTQQRHLHPQELGFDQQHQQQRHSGLETCDLGCADGAKRIKKQHDRYGSAKLFGIKLIKTWAQPWRCGIGLECCGCQDRGFDLENQTQDSPQGETQANGWIHRNETYRADPPWPHADQA